MAVLRENKGRDLDALILLSTQKTVRAAILQRRMNTADHLADRGTTFARNVQTETPMARVATVRTAHRKVAVFRLKREID
jgi:hypothetical protein